MMHTLEQWFMGRRGHVIALLAGLLVPLSFAPFHFYPLAVFSLILLFLSWQSESFSHAPLRGFLFGLGMFGAGVSWIYVAIHDFGSASILVAAVLTAIFVAFLALYLAGLGWVIRKLIAQRKTSTDLNLVLLLPVSWVLFEWFKGWFLTGFPWLELGVGQIDGPLRGYTPIIGVSGVSLLVAISAGLVLVSTQKIRIWPVVALVAIWAGGFMLVDQSWTQAKGEPVKVSVIQGNIPQQIKWNSDQLYKTIALYENLTEQHWNSDLIVWPENAIPVFHHQAKQFLLDPLAEKARANDTDILLGLPYMDVETKRYFNSMMSIGQHEAFYHKAHLVPFGEFIPMAWLRGLIAFFDLPMSDFSPGESEQPLLDVAGQKVAISICYEDVFSAALLSSSAQADFLVNASNNAWYGDSFAPHQHLQIAQNRALEFGRPTVRATTNGISALIDQQGRLQSQSGQFEQAVLTGEIQPQQGLTPYVIAGRWGVLALSLFMLLLWGYYHRNVFNKIE